MKTALGYRVGPGWATCAITLLLQGAMGCKRTAPTVDFRSRAPSVDVPRAADAPEVEADAGPRFAERSGAAVPGDGLTLRFEGSSVAAPPGQRFTQQIAWDYDHDGRDDSLIVARVMANGDAAGLTLVRTSNDAVVSGAIEGPEPEDRTCGIARFRQTSPRSLVVEWGCPANRDEGSDAGPRGMFRAEAVLMGPIGDDIGYWARAGVLREAIPGTNLGLTISGRDTNGDGVDELVCEVAAGRGEALGARARVVFFKRGDAFARDVSEPGASVQALIARQRRRAGSRRSAAAAIDAMEDLLRLRRALCDDTGLARFRLAGTVGVRCRGDVFDGASEVMLRAWVTLGELPAAWAMTRAASAHPLGVVPIERVRRLLEGASRPERGARATLSRDAYATTDQAPRMRFSAVRWENPRDPQRLVLPGEHAARVARADWVSVPAPDLAAEGVNALVPTDLARTTRFVGLAWTRAGLDAVFCPFASLGCSEAWGQRAGAIPAGALTRTLPLTPPPDVPVGDAPGSYAQAYVSADANVLGWGSEGMLLALRGRVWRIAPSGEASALDAGATWSGTYPEGQSVTEDGRVTVLHAPEGIWVHEDRAWVRLLPEALRERLETAVDATPSADGRAIALRFADSRVAVVERAARR